MRSELWVCALARTGDPCGRWRVHRDTACQQLRILVRDRRVHHARGLEGGLVGLPVLLHGVRRLKNPSRPEASIANGPRGTVATHLLRHMKQQVPAMLDRMARIGRHSNGRSSSHQDRLRSRLHPKPALAAAAAPHIYRRTVRIGSYMALASP